MIELFGAQALVNAAIYCAGALLGQILYAVVQWGRREIDSPLARFTGDVRASIAAVGANLTAILVLLQALPIDTMTPFACLIVGAMQGSSADSLFNKSKRSTWTDEERAARNGSAQ